jgi:hypothetical protein
MAASTERRMSGVSERRRYWRGGRRLVDRQYYADPLVRVNDAASERSNTSASEPQSLLAWSDFLTREVEALLNELKRLRP